MAISGTLATYSITQLFNLITLAKKSGVLRIYPFEEEGEGAVFVTPGEQIVEVGFQGGELVYADARDKNSDLVHILRKFGKLNDKQTRTIQQNRIGQSDKALALLLVNANYADKDDIAECIQRTSLEIVYDLMTWDKEPFLFDEAETVSPDRILVPTDLKDVLREGAKRVAEYQRLQEAIPNLDITLTLNAKKARHMTLSRDAWQVISLISPQTTVREIAQRSHMTDAEIRRAVLRLAQIGVVTLPE